MLLLASGQMVDVERGITSEQGHVEMEK